MKAKHPSTDPVTAAMFETAMIWRQRMEDAAWSGDDEADFEVWLQADERHQRLFEVSGEVWTYFDDHVTSPELIGARRALLGRVQRQATARWSGATCGVAARSPRMPSPTMSIQTPSHRSPPSRSTSCSTPSSA